MLALLFISTLAGCKNRTDDEPTLVRSAGAAPSCGANTTGTYDFDVEAAIGKFALPTSDDVGDITPSPSYEASEFYALSALTPAAIAADQCLAGWAVDTTSAPTYALAGGSPRYSQVRARVPHVAEEAYARPREPKASYRLPPSTETAMLHASNSTRTTRRQAIRKIETPDIMSAAAHLDLRDPQKVFFFARMIKVANEPGQHSQEDARKAADLMRKFAEQPIQINVFTKVVDGKVRIEHIECVDGNHRLAAGLVSGKWRTIGDIPVEHLDIRVNGSRPANRASHLAEKDLHWLPARIAETSEFRARFREISVNDFERRVRNAGRFDVNLLGETEYFHVPASYGPAGPSIAIRPEIPSSHPAMGGHAGVPMWQVVRRTLIRDGIVSPSDFQD